MAVEPELKDALWRQFGAAIEMLENAITACPASVWGERVDWHEFWYLASHTLFWLDYYVTDAPENFAPPAPFGLEELDPAGVLPPRVYTKAELLTYLEYGRERCHAKLAALTAEQFHRQAQTRDLSEFELLLYGLRHVQHHAAQLESALAPANGFSHTLGGADKAPARIQVRLRMEPRIPIDPDKIKIFCEKWKIVEFALFGSVLTDDFRPDSDVDVMVTFASGVSWRLGPWLEMEDELKAIFQRDVDLVERRLVEANENYIVRKSILRSSRVFYAP